MKKTGKALALLLALLVVLSLTVTAFADSTGSITVNYAKLDQVYSIYKLFDYDADGQYYYTTSQDLAEYLGTIDATGGGTTTAGSLGLLQFFSDSSTPVRYIVQVDTASGDFIKSYDSEGTVKETITADDLTEELNDADKTSLGTALTLINGEESLIVTADSNYVKLVDGRYYEVTLANDLSAGYYFVSSSLGALIALTSDSQAESFTDKNALPSIVKVVQEDSDSSWSSKATADVIDTVNYKLTVYTDNTAKVTDVYTITDALPAGFALSGDVSIAYTDINGESQTAGTTTDGVTYTAPNDANSNTMTIELSTELLKTIKPYSQIVVTYSVKMTADEVNIASANNNTAKVTYKEHEAISQAALYTYEVGGKSGEKDQPFKKVDNADNPLPGVEFVLSKDVNGTAYYARVDSNGYLTGWIDNENDAKITLTTDENGSIDVKGLDAGTYILTETETLTGYNLLTDTITVEISDDGTVTYKMTNDTSSSASETMEVVNYSGTTMPTTGGIGTTVFYVVGGLMVAAALVLLITKKRMSGYQD